MLRQGDGSVIGGLEGDRPHAGCVLEGVAWRSASQYVVPSVGTRIVGRWDSV